MTGSQEKRLDVRFIFWSYTVLFLILFSWNLWLILLVSEVAFKLTKLPFDRLMAIRRDVMEFYIKKRGIEMDGIIGPTSKYYRGNNDNSN